MRVFNGLEEYEQAVGTALGHSAWLDITQERVKQFANATGDQQWIHVDAERAAAGPFGGTVAHGYLTLSLIPLLAGEVFRVDGLSMGVNYGCNKVRFVSPVPVGSRIRASIHLVSLTPSPAGVLSQNLVTLEREDRPNRRVLPRSSRCWWHELCTRIRGRQ